MPTNLKGVCECCGGQGEPMVDPVDAMLYDSKWKKWLCSGCCAKIKILTDFLEEKDGKPQVSGHC